jgi:hypothetical protein
VHSVRNSLLIALKYIVSNKIKCVVFRLSCMCSKIWESSECIKKARHKKWFEKRSFWHAWHLNAWCGYDRSFLYLFDSNQEVTQLRGRLKTCPARSDLQCSNHHKDSRAKQDKDFFQPVCFTLGVVTLPREPQPVIPQKACLIGDAGVLIFPSIHWWK